MSLKKEHLHFMDTMVLRGLRHVGPQTKLQLLHMGMTPGMIAQLENLSILVKEHNDATNLNYYTVNNELFDGT